tara:strand:- start:2023 stop:3405 length:1383 start_codon:yes stop_codon:yes gene_type:complete
MAYLGSKRRSSDYNAVMKQVRKPVFVDNALHLGEFTAQGVDKTKVTVRQRKAANYPIATERTFTIEEGQDEITLTHTGAPGHSTTTARYDDTAPMLYSSEKPSQRLRLGSVLSTTNGLRMSVRNKRGMTLSELGFESDSGHVAFPCDAGLRTTDMAMRLGQDVDSLTSVNLTGPRTAQSGNARRRHSTTFVAKNFKAVNLLTALRFLGRHDNRVALFDRFGNLIYAPFTYGGPGRIVEASLRSGGANTDPTDESVTAVVVVGVPLAVNERAFAEVRDSERESGRGANIIEEPQRIEDFTVSSNEGARRVARAVLKANNLSAGKKTSAGHPDAFDLRPGSVIEYENVKRVLTEVRHRLSSNESDLVFLNVDIGIEGVLQGISEGIGDVDLEPETQEQVREHVLSLFGDVEIRSIAIVTLRGHGDSGMLVGRAMGRGIIGGTSSSQTIGGSKTKAIVLRGDN